MKTLSKTLNLENNYQTKYMDLIFQPHKVSTNGNQVKLVLKQYPYKFGIPPTYGAASITVNIPLLISPAELTINGFTFNLINAPGTSNNPYDIFLDSDPIIALDQIVEGINNNIYITDFYVIPNNQPTQICCNDLAENTYTENSITFFVVKKTIGLLQISADDSIGVNVECGSTTPLNTSGAYGFIEIEGSYLNYGNYTRSPIIKSEGLKYADFYRWSEYLFELSKPICEGDLDFVNDLYYVFEFKNYSNQFIFQPPPLVQINTDKPYFFTPRTCDYAMKNARIGYGNINENGVFERFTYTDPFYVLNGQLPMTIFSENKGRWGQDQVQVLPYKGTPDNPPLTEDNWDNTKLSLYNPDNVSAYYTGNKRRWLTTLLTREYAVGDIDYLQAIIPLKNEIDGVATVKVRLTRTYNDDTTDEVVSVMDFLDVFLSYQEYVGANGISNNSQLNIIQIPIHNLWSEFDWTGIKSFCIDLVYLLPLIYGDMIEDLPTGIDGTFDEPTLSTITNNPYNLLGGQYTQQRIGDNNFGVYATGTGYDNSAGLPANTMNTNYGAVFRSSFGSIFPDINWNITLEFQSERKIPECDYYYMEIWVRVVRTPLQASGGTPIFDDANFIGTVTLQTGGIPIVGGNNTLTYSTGSGFEWKKIGVFLQGGLPLIVGTGMVGFSLLMQGIGTRSHTTIFVDCAYISCASSGLQTLTAPIKCNIKPTTCEREVIMFQNEFGVPECINMDRITAITELSDRVEYYQNNEFLPISLDDRKVRIGEINKSQSITFTSSSLSANMRNWMKALYNSPNIYYLKPNEILSYCGEDLFIPAPDTREKMGEIGDKYEPHLIYGKWIPLRIDGDEFVTSTTNNFEQINLTFMTDPQRYKGRHYKK